MVSLFDQNSVHYTHMYVHLGLDGSNEGEIARSMRVREKYKPTPDSAAKDPKQTNEQAFCA